MMLLLDKLPNCLRTCEIEDVVQGDHVVQDLQEDPIVTELIDAKATEIESKGENLVGNLEIDDLEEKELTGDAIVGAAAPSHINEDARVKAILQGAGRHSLLCVVVGWPAPASLHKISGKLAKLDYVDKENHLIIELNIVHWGKTMERVHDAGKFIVEAMQDHVNKD
ncbi:hypothetical protein B0H10DRAFT_2208452 [Mycena sp. CBHHK59/15]|nr:hypothetical protein B0H10DRAFT_2208452 [Mycena sp. CBHHK59/15]